jgi:hypothetical protein
MGNVMMGTPGDDVLTVNADARIVCGLEGDDAITVSAYGGHILIGGPGADAIDFQAASSALSRNTIILNAGDGTDQASGHYGGGILAFGEGIFPKEIAMSRTGGSLSSSSGRLGSDLFIEVTGTGDGAVFKNWYAASGERLYRITFADGTVWHPMDIDAIAEGSAEAFGMPIARAAEEFWDSLADAPASSGGQPASNSGGGGGCDGGAAGASAVAFVAAIGRKLRKRGQPS